MTLRSDKAKIPFSKSFKPLYTSKKRYFLVTGGRGSVKTTFVMDFAIRASYEQGNNILYTRYSMSSAKTTIIPLFWKAIEDKGVESDFIIQATKVVNRKSGSVIYFSGIKANSKDQTGRLKSLPDIATWIVEEGEDFNDEKAFEIIDDSVRNPFIQNRVIWIQNPTTKEHFIYDKFIRKTNKKKEYYGYNVTLSSHPEVEHIHVTYHLAKSLNYLSESFVRKIEASKAKAEQEVANGADKHETQYYYTYIGGWLERAEGCIYTNWIEGAFEYTILNGNGLDYGYNPDPTAMIEIAIDKKAKKIYMRQRIYATELSDDEVLEAVSNTVDSKDQLIVADLNEPRTTKKIKKAGYNIIKAQKPKGSISGGIRELQSYQFVVDSDSHDLKIELNNYVWNDKKASIPIDDYNHLLDGLRYIYRKLTAKKPKGIKRRN